VEEVVGIWLVMMDREEFAVMLEEIGRTRMPFGRYGPGHYPPDGVPLYELPSEYLQWFVERGGGFPVGRLGELMRLVYEIKIHGMGEVFAPLRLACGGRMKLGRKRPRDYRFEDG